jgi:adenine phosphoribosyltransferase
MMDIKTLIRTVPDFPKPGIRFRDITPLLGNPTAMRYVTHEFARRYEGKIDKVAAIEARGFLFGAMLAHALHAGLVPVRKPGKLPSESIGHDYALEYGTNRVEIHTDAVRAGERVVIVDDLLATGGTAMATVALLDRLEAHVVECAFVIDLAGVGGRAKLEHRGLAAHALCTFAEDE